MYKQFDPREQFSDFGPANLLYFVLWVQILCVVYNTISFDGSLSMFRKLFKIERPKVKLNPYLENLMKSHIEYVVRKEERNKEFLGQMFVKEDTFDAYKK